MFRDVAQALLYQNLDSPAAKRSYELVTLDCKDKKPNLACCGPLPDTLELPFAGHVRVGATKGKSSVKVCDFMGLHFYVGPPTKDVNCGGGEMPVAAWCVSTVKDKDANMSVVRTTITKRFNLSTFEFVHGDAPNRKQTLKRKVSETVDDAGFPETNVEIHLTALKPKKCIGDEDVKLTVGQTAVNVQAPPAMPTSAVEDLLAGLEKVSAANGPEKKKQKKPAGGTWSAKHLLR